MNQHWAGWTAALVWVVVVSLAGGAETAGASRAPYARPFEPAARKAFLPLPPGLVEPAGWLRDWCQAAKEGYTGHMDEVDVEFRRAWAADHQMTGDRLNWPQGAWPYEGGGYWFDGLTRLGHILHDESLIQQAQRRFAVVVDNMRPNSILFLWWLDKNQPFDAKSVEAGGGWSLWASGLLGRALAAHYDGSHDPRVLRTLEMAYATDRDWPCMGWGMSNPWPAFGPLLFVLPIPDTQDANTPDPDARWKFALDGRPETLAADITVERQAMPARWDWPLEAPLRLRAQGIPCDWNPEPTSPLPSAPVTATGPAEPLTLIPYGCTKFRVSMFPVTPRTIDAP